MTLDMLYSLSHNRTGSASFRRKAEPSLFLDVMTSSYREAELKKVFVSHRLEFWLVRWSERLLHGLNLLLIVGLLILSAGVVGLLASDILYALQETLETGVIKALGSLLILWMMIELLHTQVENLRGGRRYPRAGYGGTFFHWLHSSDPRPYNPFILKYPPGPPPESTDPSPVAGP